MNDEIQFEEFMAKLHRLFDRPVLVAGDNSRVKVEFKEVDLPTGVITNPRALLDLLDKFHQGVWEATQCEVMDHLIQTILACANNVHALKHLMTQPTEYLTFP
jgi:hypothetical protein